MSMAAVFVGDESLLVQCAEQWLSGGESILAVATADPHTAAWATEKGVPVVQPGEGLAERLPQGFDFLFSIANLRMIPPAVLGLARRAAINFHDGPLPRYAGLNAPVWAMIAGEPEHGITWHLMTEKADQGNILVQKTFPIEADDTSLTLNARCYENALESFDEVLRLIRRDGLYGRQQPDSGGSYFGLGARPAHFAALDFTQPPDALARLGRALDFGQYDNPVAWPKLVVGDRVVYVGEIHVHDDAGSEPPGNVRAIEGSQIVVSAQGGAVALSHFRDAAGNALAVADVAERLRLAPGRSIQPDAETLSTLTEIAAATRHDAFWAKRLRKAEPAPAPLAAACEAGSTAPHARRLSDGRGHAAALAAFGLWLARLSGKRELWLQASAELPETALHRALLDSRLPARLVVDERQGFGALVEAAERELQRLKTRSSFSRDLVGRTPGHSPTPFSVGVHLSGESEPLGDRRLRLDLGLEGATLRLHEHAYGERTADDIAEQIRVLCEAGERDPARPAGDLSLLSEAARAELLETFNDTFVPQDAALATTVFGDFERRAAEHPDVEALVFADKHLSYGELNRRANRVAHRLLSVGVEPQSLIGVFLPRTDDLVVAVLGILKAGCAYLPLDPAYPADRLAYMLEDSSARWAVTTSALQHDLPQGVSALPLDADAELPRQSTENPGRAVSPEHLAYIIYTSGSTGKPKGVMLEHRNVTNFFVGMDARVPRFETNTWLAVTSLSFDISVLELLWTLGRGFKVVLASENRADLSKHVEQGGLSLEMSLFYFSSDEGGVGAEKYRLLMEGARYADDNGFVAVWTPERHFGAFGGLYPNPSVTSAAIAAITKNVQIRAGSCVLPLHEPARVAEEWAVVDNLSGGRVGISFAAGWHPHDFLLKRESFKERKAVMLSDLEVVRKLWRGEKVEFQSPVGPTAVQSWPRPVQAELPVWLTAAGNVETFVAAARSKAGILTHLLGQSLPELQGKIAAYRAEWKRLGHPGDGHVALMLHTFVARTDEEAKRIVREPMKQYLKSSINLIAEHAWSFPAFKRSADPNASLSDNFGSLAPNEMDALLDFSFERYFETAGLFGSEERCLATLRQAEAIGVSEVACLIDFGVPVDAVLDQLPRLKSVKERAARPPQLDKRDFSLAGQLLRHRATHLQCTPSMGRMLLTDEGSQSALVGVKAWMLGGEALPPSLVQQIRSATGAAIINMYGPTETTVWSSTDRIVGDEVTLGKPIANTQMYVLDAQQRLLPRGAEGELYISGDSVARGYLNRPELTAERFVENPFVERRGARMYRTGDLVRYREDGRLSFLGRTDDQVKIRGHRIELGEIEAAISAVPQVLQAVVVARHDTPGDARLVAYYRVAEEAPGGEATVVVLSESALRSQLSARLPDYMVPSHLIPLKRFPLTPNAKVDKKALPPPGATQPRAAKAFVAPQSETETGIIAVFQRVLGLEGVGATDNFFELGGHSLLAVQAHREICQSLDLKLSITDLFRYPTARSLDEHVRGALDQSTQEGTARADARRAALERRGSLRRARRG